mmetsp:Transcript_23399/g.39099  ORF Transcript_23399/g.39099 Transcript_23399/m.39099 type:complete len:279 (-) Transcript_23399:1729-2565(-)
MLFSLLHSAARCVPGPGARHTAAAAEGKPAASTLVRRVEQLNVIKSLQRRALGIVPELPLPGEEALRKRPRHPLVVVDCHLEPDQKHQRGGLHHPPCAEPVPDNAPRVVEQKVAHQMQRAQEDHQIQGRLRSLGEVPELALVEVAEAGEDHDARDEGQVGEHLDPHLAVAGAGAGGEHDGAYGHGGHVDGHERVHRPLLAEVRHLKLLDVLEHGLLVVAADVVVATEPEHLVQVHLRHALDGNLRLARLCVVVEHVHHHVVRGAVPHHGHNHILLRRS